MSLPRLSLPRPRLLAPGLLAPVLLAAALLPAQPALAAPATEAEMEVYTRLAALNLCIARAAGVEFDLAVGVAAETISVWIQGNHQSGVAPVSTTPLSLEDLRKGSVNSALLGAAELCPDELPKEVLRDVQQAVEAATPAAPARP
ncbi:MAG: cAMP phosphodiesterase [Cyanobacteria bacterium J06638_7]